MGIVDESYNDSTGQGDDGEIDVRAFNGTVRPSFGKVARVASTPSKTARFASRVIPALAVDNGVGTRQLGHCADDSGISGNFDAV